MPLFVLAHFGHHLLASLLQPLMPYIRDNFKLDYTQAGFVVSAYTLFYGLSQLPAGWLADHFGARLLLTTGVAGVAFCGLLVGIAPNYIFLLICLILLGLAGGGYHPAASPIVSMSVPKEKQGLALGLHQIGGTASFFVAPLLAAGIASFLNWRGPFIVLSIPLIVFGFLLNRSLKQKGYDTITRRDEPRNHVISPPVPGYLRRLVALTAIGAAVQIFMYTTISFVPFLVVDQYQAPKWVGSVMLSLAQFSGLWAGPIGGYVSDRIGKVRVLVTTSLVAGPAVFLLSIGTYWWLLPVLLLTIGACQYVAMPVSEAYIITNAPQQNRSMILGIYYAASRGGPALLTPVIGKLIDNSGFSRAFALEGAALFVIVTGFSLLLWSTRARSRVTPATPM